MKLFLRLANYEFKKVFKNLVFIIAFVILLAGILLHHSTLVEDSSGLNNQKIYEDMRWQLNEQNYNALNSVMEVANLSSSPANKISIPEFGGEYPAYIVSRAGSRAEYLLQTDQNWVYTRNQAKNNIPILKKTTGAEYMLHYNETALQQYSNRLPLVMADTMGWEVFFNYYGDVSPFNPPDIVMAIVCLLAFCTIFTVDEETLIAPIVKTTRYGHRTLFASRFTCAAIISALVVILFSLPLFLRVMQIYSYCSPLVSIQNIEGYADCAFNISILGGVLLMVFSKILTMIFLYGLVALLGALTKKRFIALAGSLLVYGGLYALCYDYQDIWAGINQLSYQEVLFQKSNMLFNPTASTYIRRYFLEFDYVNVLGYPIHRIIFLFAFMIILIAILLFATYFVYSHKGRRSKKLNKVGGKANEALAII